MSDPIQDLENPYIVCGGGETGRHIIDELLQSGMDVVLGLKGPTEAFVFNPDAATRLVPGTTLIVMGEESDIARAKRDFQGAPEQGQPGPGRRTRNGSVKIRDRRTRMASLNSIPPAVLTTAARKIC